MYNSVEIFPVLEFKGHVKGVECVAINPALETQLISGSHDHFLKLWDINSRTCAASVEAHKEGVWTCDYTSDGNNCVTGSPDKSIKIWDLKKLKTPLKTFTGHNGHVYWTRYNENNTLIASGGADSTIIIWDLKKGDAIKKITIDDQIVYSVEFSKCGNYLIACDSIGTIYVYDSKTFNLVSKSEAIKDRAYAVAVDFSEKSRTKNYIFAAFQDKMFRKFLFDPIQRKITLEKEYGGHFDQLKYIALSSKRGMIATGCRDGTAKLWNCENQAYIATLLGGNDCSSCISFGSTSLIAVAGWDQSVKVFKVPNK